MMVIEAAVCASQILVNPAICPFQAAMVSGHQSRPLELYGIIRAASYRHRLIFIQGKFPVHGDRVPFPLGYHQQTAPPFGSQHQDLIFMYFVQEKHFVLPMNGILPGFREAPFPVQCFQMKGNILRYLKQVAGNPDTALLL